jgi:hypothetical protein
VLPKRIVGSATGTETWRQADFRFLISRRWARWRLCSKRECNVFSFSVSDRLAPQEVAVMPHDHRIYLFYSVLDTRHD